MADPENPQSNRWAMGRNLIEIEGGKMRVEKFSEVSRQSISRPFGTCGRLGLVPALKGVLPKSKQRRKAR